MIISHQNKFVFYKPMKTAGTSIEAALIPHCGPDDLITGSVYIGEIDSDETDFHPRNNWEDIELVGDEAKIYASDMQQEFVTHPPMPWNIKDSISKAKVTKPIFDSHTTPEILRQHSEISSLTKDYMKITATRNPWDAAVSYYWWCYYAPPFFHGVFDGEALLGQQMTGDQSLCPLFDDNIHLLRSKFRCFLESSLNHDGPYGIIENCNTLKWISSLTECYYDPEIDFVIRYENLENELSDLFEELSLDFQGVPETKTSQRKANLSYDQYYDKVSKDMVEDAFSRMIGIFGYEFGQ